MNLLTPGRGSLGEAGKMTFHSKPWRELLEAPKDVGITTLVVEILFGLSGGVALIFHNI
jgi:hypothetical protein